MRFLPAGPTRPEECVGGTSLDEVLTSYRLDQLHPSKLLLVASPSRHSLQWKKEYGTILMNFGSFLPLQLRLTSGVSTADSESGKGQKFFQGVMDHLCVAVVLHRDHGSTMCT